MELVATDIVKSIDEIKDPMVKNKLEELCKEPHVLGVMTWGSRATGFGAQESDWDVLIYVTNEFYSTLSPMDTAIIEFDESVEPKRLVNDLTYLADVVFEDQLNSPLDIDHSAYSEGVVIYDPTGKLEEWRQKLARYPEEEHTNRVRMKWIQVVDAFYTARRDDQRGFIPDRQLNLHRAILSAVHLWFSLQKSWSPPLKWWTNHTKRLNMDDETYRLFCAALENPTLESVENLVKRMKEQIDEKKVDLGDFHAVFLETLMPTGRPKLIRHTYM